MIMKLLTTSTTDGDANDITYGFALRSNCAKQAGGLPEVLNLLRFAISDAKVLDHLYSTFRDVLIYLDPDDQLSNDDLHEDLPDNVDSEVMMTFLLTQVCCDSLGGIKKVFDMRDNIPITEAAFANHTKYGQGSPSDIYNILIGQAAANASYSSLRNTTSRTFQVMVCSRYPASVQPIHLRFQHDYCARRGCC